MHKNPYFLPLLRVLHMIHGAVSRQHCLHIFCLSKQYGCSYFFEMMIVNRT